MNKDKLSVTVSVLERKYKLSIESNDEEFLRKAANLIDSQAKGYAKVYGHKDTKNYLPYLLQTNLFAMPHIMLFHICLV